MLKGYIEFTTHAVQVIIDEDRGVYKCFKTAVQGGDKVCDLMVFADEGEAVEYVLEPFPEYRIVMVMDEEE